MYGISELCAVSAHDGDREYRVPAQDGENGAGGNQGKSHAGAGRPAFERFRHTLSTRIVRRPAATWRGRARTGVAAQVAVARRAALGDGCQVARTDAD